MCFSNSCSNNPLCVLISPSPLLSSLFHPMAPLIVTIVSLIPQKISKTDQVTSDLSSRKLEISILEKDLRKQQIELKSRESKMKKLQEELKEQNAKVKELSDDCEVKDLKITELEK